MIVERNYVEGPIVRAGTSFALQDGKTTDGIFITWEGKKEGKIVVSKSKKM